MSTPFFTAEASVYRPLKSYRGNVATGGGNVAERAVTPQAPLCGNSCVWGCAGVAGACGVGCVIAAALSGPFSPAPPFVL